MKKLNFILLLTTLLFIPTLHSCLDDDDDVEKYLAVSTIKVPDEAGKEFYFVQDDGKKMYPGDTRYVSNYKAKDGQRAFVIYTKLEEQPVQGYDSNTQIRNIVEILTKDIVTLTPENEEKIGDDPINAVYMWVAQGYLTIEFQYYGTHREDKKHFLNLVINQLPDSDPAAKENTSSDDDYVNLEFRHNSEGDSPTWLGEGYVSFKLDEIASQLEGKKGLKVRVKTLYDGIKEIPIDFAPSSEQPTTLKNSFNSVYSY